MAGRLLQGLLRWLAPLTAIAFTWIALKHYEVSYADSAKLTAYLVFGVTLPGMLVWRRLRRRTGVFYLDAAAGFAVGCAIQLAVYLPGRWLGVPEVVVVAPIIIVVAFLTDGRLRRWWRGSAKGSVWGAWIIALVVIFGVAMLSIDAFRSEPLEGYGAGYVYVDIPFHLALAAELKHHVPFQTPYVWELPLQYHWYAHAHVAATSWATGVEIETLIRRVVPISMLLAVTVGTAGLAQSWARRRWTGPVAAAVLIGVSSVTLYGWNRHTSGTVLDTPWWASPSQSFGQVMVIPAIALLVGIVRGRKMPKPGVWILFTLSVAGVMAAKATMVPLLLAAVVAAFASWLIFRRKFHLPSLVALLIVVAGLAFAQFVIFGGASQGTTIRPFDTIHRFLPFWGFRTGPGDSWYAGATAAGAVVDVYGYLLLAAGLFAFGRRLLVNPGVASLFAVTVAGLGAAMVFVQHGNSERYFTRSAAALMIPMAVWGVALLIRRSKPLRVKVIMAVAFMIGPFLALLIGWQTFPKPLASGPKQNWQALGYMLGPISAAVGIALLIGALLSLLTKRMGTRASAAGLACIVLMGMGVLPTYRVVARNVQAVEANGLDHVITRVGPTDIPWRGEEAARFLRANSSPEDLVATNAHCRIPERIRCDARAFWLAGYSERRILLEGWAYTVQANLAEERDGALYGRFWDPELEARNDGVFLDPNPNSAAILKERYGVDFLFVDKRTGEVDEDKMNVIATKIYDLGESQIWQLR